MAAQHRQTAHVQHQSAPAGMAGARSAGRPAAGIGYASGASSARGGGAVGVMGVAGAAGIGEGDLLVLA